MDSKDCFVDYGSAQGSVDQGFKGMHYFQSMRLQKEAFGAIVQANVGSIIENFEAIAAVESSKLIFLFLFKFISCWHKIEYKIYVSMLKNSKI